MKEKIQYLSEKDVAEITKLSLSTLRNYRCLGKAPVYLKVGKAVRYRENDIIRFMERNRIEPRDER
jgi:predicted site-specific integrase-resolvase